MKLSALEHARLRCHLCGLATGSVLILLVLTLAVYAVFGYSVSDATYVWLGFLAASLVVSSNFLERSEKSMQKLEKNPIEN
jgi:hypothetical protein